MKINKSNYIKLVLLIAVTIAITFLFVYFYNEIKNKNLMASYLDQITVEDIDQYILEHPDTILYIKYKDQNLSLFESDLKRKVEKNNLSDDIVYVLYGSNDISAINKILRKYNFNKDISDNSLILVMIDKKIQTYKIISKNEKMDDFIDYEVFK